MSKNENIFHNLVNRLQTEGPNRALDKECAEYFGWRVGRDQWWLSREDETTEPNDDWAIRVDGDEDALLDRPLPNFTPDMMIGVALGIQSAQSKSAPSRQE